MKVCKHGYDVKMFDGARGNHASTHLKKVGVENSTILLGSLIFHQVCPGL